MNKTSYITNRRKWLIENEPFCILCDNFVGSNGDLTHIIRQSYSIKLQMNDLNNGLSHRACHQIFDDQPKNAKYLPRINEVLKRMKSLDEKYYNRYVDRMK